MIKFYVTKSKMVCFDDLIFFQRVSWCLVSLPSPHNVSCLLPKISATACISTWSKLDNELQELSWLSKIQWRFQTWIESSRSLVSITIIVRHYNILEHQLQLARLSIYHLDYQNSFLINRRNRILRLTVQSKIIINNLSIKVVLLSSGSTI